jgi:hypothetical protein
VGLVETAPGAGIVTVLAVVERAVVVGLVGIKKVVTGPAKIKIAVVQIAVQPEVIIRLPPIITLRMPPPQEGYICPLRHMYWLPL